ncbi:tripartite tricarboxylate transporter TctB family protein [Verminephrobacter eiseniae]|uniref:tripartite tricarboxylate transporter TctB family protein n=1 Tax=Verminephrobacter eiseniae TaxID=364317 RepID=UPI002238114F|nr:tripartite tricarboxylate transporter TctB family protein [Verminephrobacter eiseniae]MCW5238692.1 tripartite tricarboxylate transporter TctB family protein [Verminephrobacter eiseniae]
MKINDTLSGLLLAIFAAAIFIYAGTFPSMKQQMGPALFPQLLAGGFMICAFLLIYKGLRQTRTEAWFSLPPWFGERRAVFAYLLVLLSLVFYICACEALGFLPTATILLLSLSMTFGARLAVAMPMAIASALGIHCIFYKLLKVPLPWGMLESIAW